MLKAMTDAQFGQIVQYKLKTELPDGFVPEQILYRRIHVPDPGFAPRYEFISLPLPLIGPDYNGIENFAMLVAKSGHAGAQDREEVKWLGIKVSKPSWIVLHLSPSEGNWTFTATTSPEIQPAVTMGRVPDPDNPPELYGALHYATDSRVYPTLKAGCTVVYFAAMPAFGSEELPYIQKMNYIVDVEGGTTNLMDPDIRHPGVGVS